MSTLEKTINFTREAFLHPLNMGMLFTSTLAAFFLNDVGQVSNLIFTVAFGMELMYLGIVPRLPRYQKSVRMRKLRERNEAMEERIVFQELDRKSQKRFLVLKHLSKLIKQNFDKLPYSSQGLLENIRNKIQELLSNYLTLLDLNKRYRTYIDSSLEKKLHSDIEREEKLIAETDSERLKNTKKRRLTILKKRLKRFEAAKEKSMICETHLETIEDAVRYIYEQSMTMSDPEEIGFQLDNLLMEVEETSQIINDLDEEILPMYNDSVSELSLDDELEETQEELDNVTNTKQRVKE